MTYKRRKIYIGSKLQKHLIILSFINALVFLIIILAFENALTNVLITEISGQSKSDICNVLILQLFESKLYSYGIAAIGIFIWTFIISLYFSHRIAGPIFNITRVVDAALNNEKTAPSKLRKNDYFNELSDKVNQLVSLLNSKK